MALKTLGGFEVELIETNPPGRPWESKIERGTGHKGKPLGPRTVWPFVDLRRVDTGKIYERFDIAGLRSRPEEVGAALRAIRGEGGKRNAGTNQDLRPSAGIGERAAS